MDQRFGTDGMRMADHSKVREFYLKLKLKGSPGYRHLGRVIRLGAPTPGCAIDISYSGQERHAIVRSVEYSQPSGSGTVPLPVVHADEI